MFNKNIFKITVLVLVSILLVLVFYRDVSVDEGVYLYAGKLVAGGKIPYVDFAHVQGPLFPLFYGMMNVLVGQDICINRIVTAIFGAGGLIFAGLIAKKLGGFGAWLIYLLLLISSPYILSHYMVIATYSITAFFLYLALFLATEENKTPFSYLSILVASAVRLSVLSVVPVFGSYLILKSKEREKTFFVLSGMTILFFFVVFLPFIFISPDVFFYNLFGIHITSMKINQRLYIMMDTLAVNLKDYSVLMICFLLSFWYLLKKKNTPFNGEPLLWQIFVVLFITHLFPVQSRGSYYNSLNFPAAIIIIAYVFSKINGRKNIILISAAAIFLNFTEQAVLVEKYNIIVKNRPIERINMVSEYVAEKTGKKDKILAFSTLLAVQSNRAVPDEFAEDCFSYKGDWPTDKCRKYKRVNNEIFMDYVADKKIMLIALGDFDLHQFGPDKKNILKKIEKEKFGFVKKFENFGQWHDNLYVFARR